MDLLAAHVAFPQLKPPSHRDPTPTPLLSKVAKLGQVPFYNTTQGNYSVLVLLHWIFSLSEQTCVCSRAAHFDDKLILVFKPPFVVQINLKLYKHQGVYFSTFSRQSYSIEQRIRRLRLAASRLYRSHQTRFLLMPSPGEQKKHKDNCSNESP